MVFFSLLYRIFFFCCTGQQRVLEQRKHRRLFNLCFACIDFFANYKKRTPKQELEKEQPRLRDKRPKFTQPAYDNIFPPPKKIKRLNNRKEKTHYGQLQKTCTSLGLPARGTQKVLEERIRKAGNK